MSSKMSVIHVITRFLIFSAIFCVFVKGEEQIPKTFDEALEALGKLVSEDDQTRIAKGEIDPVDMHFGLGMSLRNNWKLWHDSELAKYLKRRGFEHPDGMSGVLLKGFCLKLQGEKYDLLSVIQASNQELEQSFVDFIPDSNKSLAARAGAILFRKYSYGPEQTIVEESLVWHPETGKIHLKIDGEWKELVEEGIAVFEQSRENWLFNDRERKILEELRLESPEERWVRFESMSESRAWKFSGLFDVAARSQDTIVEEGGVLEENQLPRLD